MKPRVLRAYAAEKAHEIEQPAAFLFRVAKNVALTELTKKSRQITDYLEDASDTSIAATAPSADPNTRFRRRGS